MTGDTFGDCYLAACAAVFAVLLIKGIAASIAHVVFDWKQRRKA